MRRAAIFLDFLQTSLQRSALLYSQFFTYLPTSSVAADDFKAQYIHPHSPLSHVMFDV